MTHTNIIKQLLTFPVCWRWRGGCCRKLGDRLPGRCWTPQPVASSALASWLGSLDTVMAISSCCSRVSVLVVSLSASVPCAASSASPTAARDSSGVFTVLRCVYSWCTNFLMTAFDGTENSSVAVERALVLCSLHSTSARCHAECRYARYESETAPSPLIAAVHSPRSSTSHGPLHCSALSVTSNYSCSSLSHVAHAAIAQQTTDTATAYKTCPGRLNALQSCLSFHFL